MLSNYRRQSKINRLIDIFCIKLQTCISISIRVNVSSCNGPHQQRTVLIIVKFVVEIMISSSEFLYSRYRINFVIEKNWSINQPSGFKSFFLNSISDGLSLFNSGFNLNDL
jgi:hypothetical protein